tara:strand:- start:160 stop:501 length:342 start_codon:yes stop_codon:yes gene_type:complete
MEHYYQQIECDLDALGCQYTHCDEPIPEGLSQLLWGFGSTKATISCTWEYEPSPAYYNPEVGHNDEVLMSRATFRAWRLNCDTDIPNELREEVAVWASKLLPHEPISIGWEEL